MNREIRGILSATVFLTSLPLRADVIKCGVPALEMDCEMVVEGEGIVSNRATRDRSPATHKPRAQPLFVLKDGTRVAGKMDLPSYPLKTPYGLLVIPAADVMEVRFGKLSDPDFRKRVDLMIRDLGAADVAAREKATRDLSALGAWVGPELAAAAESQDPEIRSRAAELAAALDDQESEEYTGDLDEVVTRHFSARGELQVKSFAVETQYGKLAIPVKDVRCVFVSSPEETTKTVAVTGQNTPVSWCDTGIRVGRGDRLAIRAAGSVFLQNWGGAVSPGGNPQWGQQFPGIATGALVARIGKNGNLFLVGDSHEGVSDREGTLFLALGINGMCPSNGEFKVDVRVTPR